MLFDYMDMLIIQCFGLFQSSMVLPVLDDLKSMLNIIFLSFFLVILMNFFLDDGAKARHPHYLICVYHHIVEKEKTVCV